MCNGDAWGQRHAVTNCANCNICGIFGADFGMNGGGGRKAGTTTCRCPWTNKVGQVVKQVLEHTWQHKQTKRGVHVDVH